MKRRRSMIPACVLAFLVLGCASYRYIPIESEEIQVFKERGVSIAVIRGETAQLRSAAGDEDDYIKFEIEIKNTGTEPIHLNEDCATIGQGTEKDALVPAQKTYPATEFHKKQAEAANARACCLAIGAFGSTVTAIRKGTPSSYLNAYIATDNLRDEVHESGEYLDYLKHNLLYATDVLPGSEYFGVVYGKLWRPGADSPVKKESTIVSLTLRLKDRDYVFYFERRERD